MKYQKHKLEWISLGMFTIIMVLAWFNFGFLWKKIKAEIDHLQALQLDQETSQSLLSKVPQLRKEKELIDKHKNELEVFFSKDNALNLAQDLEKIAQETDNKIIIKAEEKNQKELKRKAQSKKEVKVAPLADNYLLITIKLKGKKEKAVEFIKKLNQLPYLLTILSIDISREKDPIFEKMEEDNGNSFETGMNIKSFNNNNNNKNNINKINHTSNLLEKEAIDEYYTTLKVAFYTQENINEK